MLTACIVAGRSTTSLLERRPGPPLTSCPPSGRSKWTGVSRRPSKSARSASRCACAALCLRPCGSLDLHGRLYHGSPQHDMDHHTPGAGEYEIPGSMGKQPLKRSNPSYTLGVRRYHGGTVDAVDQGTPGPNAYRNIPTAVDRQVDSTRPSSPRFSIGARLWHNSPQEFLERGTPGPGACELRQAFATVATDVHSQLFSADEQPGIGRKLPDSRQRTPSSFTMGARLYKGSPEEALSHDSPGPQAYAYVGAMGKQVVSTKTTYGGARWSQSPRFGLSPRRAKQMEERLRGIGKGPVGSPRLPPTHSGSSPRRPSAGPRPGTSGSPRRSPRRTPRAATAEPGSRGRPGGGGPAGKRKPKNTTATGGTYGQRECRFALPLLRPCCSHVCLAPAPAPQPRRSAPAGRPSTPPPARW